MSIERVHQGRLLAAQALARAAARDRRGRGRDLVVRSALRERQRDRADSRQGDRRPVLLVALAGPGAGRNARPLRRHLDRRQPRLRPLRPARPSDRLGAGDARLPQQARSDAERGRRLPDPLPRALRARTTRRWRARSRWRRADGSRRRTGSRGAASARRRVHGRGARRRAARRLALRRNRCRADRGDGRARTDHAPDPGDRARASRPPGSTG